MITHTVLNVEIDNKTMPHCIGLQLSQSIHGHHFFRIEYSGRSIESDPISLASDSVKLVGTSAKIGFSNSNGEAKVFWGIVTAVHAKGTNQAGYTQNIVFEGYSPTILLENGPSCQAYTNLNYPEIIQMVCGAAPANLLTVINKPRFREKLTYSVQYNESDFAFLNRMARRFGEWCYYDGLELVFGDKTQPTLELLYGYNLSHFDFSMKTGPVARKFTTHGYKVDEVLQGATKASDSNLNGMVAHAMQASEKTWQPTGASYLNQFDDEVPLKGQFDTVTRLNLQASAANRVNFTGTSSHPGLFPGAVVNVRSVAPENYREFGQYVITAINHQYTDGGRYQNQFEAVPFDVEVSPQTGTGAFPVCSPQSGKVTDNNDPEGLGRVKVKLQWQRDTTTPWLRISMPYTGSDKGMFFVPEIGEEVVVGFENGNAEKPYVMGSLYHGKAKPDSFVSKKNDIKAIRSRSGHTISLDDTDGKEMFTLSDKGGSIIQFDAKEKSLYITAPENLEISAKNIKITAEENIEIGAKENVNLAAEKDINALAEGSLALQSKKDTTIKADGAATVEAAKDATITGQNVAVEGKAKAELTSSGQTNVLGKVTIAQGAAGKTQWT